MVRGSVILIAPPSQPLSLRYQRLAGLDHGLYSLRQGVARPLRSFPVCPLVLVDCNLAPFLRGAIGEAFAPDDGAHRLQAEFKLECDLTQRVAILVQLEYGGLLILIGAERATDIPCVGIEGRDVPVPILQQVVIALDQLVMSLDERVP